MRVLILLALLGAAAAAPKTIPSRIVGGSPTTVDNYPYISNMQYLWAGFLWSQACGGSLINTQSVLSAAHCYIGDASSQWRVRLGTSFASSGGSIHLVSQLLLHPQYNDNTIDNDVAIVRLATPAVYSLTVGAVSIPGPNYNIADGTEVTTIGWGTFSSGGFSPEQLQHVDINIINQGYCVERYDFLRSQPGFGAWPPVTGNMICAGIQYIGGKDACQGDSGGPLLHNNVVVGIVSWGYGCAHAEFPGVFSRTNQFTDWIVANA